MFKQCAMCRQEWISRENFLRDPDITLIGYQADFKNPDNGLYLFNHVKQGCATTLSFHVHEFADLFTGEYFTEDKFQTHSCPGYCLDVNNTEACSAECRNSYPRRLMQIIKKKMHK